MIMHTEGFRNVHKTIVHPPLKLNPFVKQVNWAKQYMKQDFHKSKELAKWVVPKERKSGCAMIKEMKELYFGWESSVMNWLSPERWKMVLKLPHLLTLQT